MSRGGSYPRWVLACALAETIGMTAAATAARLGQDASADGGAGRRWLALAIVVVGGLVEGVALGILQATVLGSRWPSLRRVRFVLLTVAVAGVGWACASAPGVLGGDESGSGPPLVWIVLAGAGIGVVMGPVLGAAQAVALRHVVPHPWRWVAANTAAWPVAMAVIFLGASTASADWSVPVVAAYGAATGLVAGAVLGAVSGIWLASLTDQPVGHRLALAMVAGRRFGMHRRVVGLGVTARQGGRLLRFPVHYADYRVGGADFVVVPGHPEHKTWWRNLTDGLTSLWVLDAAGWHPARALVLRPGDEGHAPALATYRRRWRHFVPAEQQPVVLLQVVGPGIPATARGFLSVRW